MTKAIKTIDGSSKRISISEIRELGMRGNGEFYAVLINKDTYAHEGIVFDYNTYRMLKNAMIYGEV